jgi:charged multivesicular body protein 1
MDKFEQQFENLDVTSNYMEQSMSETTALSTPEDEVNT